MADAIHGLLCKAANRFGADVTQARTWLCTLGLILLLWSVLRPVHVHAQVMDAQPVAQAAQFGDSLIQDIRLLYAPEDGLYLSVTSVLRLPETVQSALEQGIPVYFVAEASLSRPRWWLLTRQDAVQRRFWRLSYQPLTRKWRVQTSSVSSEHTDQPTGLAQIFDGLDEALTSMQRIAGWRIAAVDELKPGMLYDMAFSFGLDKHRVPRPLQISEIGRTAWDLQLEMRRPFAVPSAP